MITINKVTLFLNLSTIEKYINNIDISESNNIIAPRLPQLKSYLRNLDILYLIKNTNVFITFNIVKRIIKSIFNSHLKLKN